MERENRKIVSKIKHLFRVDQNEEIKFSNILDAILGAKSALNNIKLLTIKNRLKKSSFSSSDP